MGVKQTAFYFGFLLIIGFVIFKSQDPKNIEIIKTLKIKQKVEFKSHQVKEPTKPPEILNKTISNELRPEVIPLQTDSFSVYQGQGKGVGFGSQHEGAVEQLLNDIRSQQRLPKVMSRTQMTYPDQAKSKGIEGYVIIKVLVATTGEILQSQIIKSEPQGIFDTVVKQSIKNWKFEPGIDQGRLANMWSTQKVRFELD